MPPTKSPLDRRKFLGSAAALSLSAASYANVPGSNDRVRVGFIGCGGRAQAHIDIVNRLPHSVPAAVCDVWDGLEDEYDVEFGGKVTRRRYAQGLFPSAKRCGLDVGDKTRVTKDFRRVLDLKDVDAVCIATPDHWHGKMTADAMLAGKDVFVETPMARRAAEATALLDIWKKTGRVVTVGVQSMADPVWVRAFDFVRTGKLGHVAHAQTGAFRNDERGQWRYYRVAECMTPKTIDWDLFLGHQHEFAGEPVGPPPTDLHRFSRGMFAQWRCTYSLCAGPLTEMLGHNLTHTLAAAGLRYPGRVVAGGGIYLEYDGRTVPDMVSVIADYEEGCQVVLTASTITGYPMEEVIRGRLGAIKFVKGGFQVFRDDPSRGAVFPPRLERPIEPTEFVSVEPPRNETEALWENFLESARSRRQSTFCPPDLGAAAVATTTMAELSYGVSGAAMYWDKERRNIAEVDSPWASRWEKRSAGRGKPNQVFGWTGGDAGSTLNPPAYQKLAGPWVNGKDPAS
ncbi:MAG TPA: Gfo/Idh/MocA family oxidoreductase [Gemmataceae bacterium]|nr:Gfo/Idh/MocA family oxidoreductase [Gemmataceae bacterium]